MDLVNNNNDDWATYLSIQSPFHHFRPTNKKNRKSLLKPIKKAHIKPPPVLPYLFVSILSHSFKYFIIHLLLCQNNKNHCVSKKPQISQMASNLLSIQACMPSPSPSTHDRSKSGSVNPSWWSPLFGWSSEPDYIDDPEKSSIPDSKTARSQRFAPGCFTEEKAKQLRMMTKETSFHDAMYHSAIASRLATDFKNRSDR